MTVTIERVEDGRPIKIYEEAIEDFEPVLLISDAELFPLLDDLDNISLTSFGHDELRALIVELESVRPTFSERTREAIDHVTRLVHQTLEGEKCVLTFNPFRPFRSEG